MGVKFRLKSGAGSKKLIFLVYYFSGQEFVYSTGEKVAPDLWNKDRAVRRKGRSDFSSLNALLDRYEMNLKTIIRNHKIDGVPITKKELKRQMDLFTGSGNEAKENGYNVISYGDRMVSRMKNTGMRWQPLNTTIRQLEKYDSRIAFNDVGIVFYEDFVNYMQSKNFSKNYIGRTIGFIIQIMNEAVEEGLTKNTKYKSSKFKRISENVYNIYLTIEELEVLHNHKFKTESLENACDWFLIGAFT